MIISIDTRSNTIRIDTGLKVFNFDESKVKRDKDGQFASKDGGAESVFQQEKYEQNLSDIFKNIKSGDNSEKNIKLGVVSERLKKDADTLGLVDLSEFEHCVDNYGIKHALKEHGDNKREALRGQIAITENDFRNIPEILKDYDNISASKTRNGRDAIVYSKKMNDGSIVYVEEIRTGKKRLSLQTMYKRKS